MQIFKELELSAKMLEDDFLSGNDTRYANARPEEWYRMDWKDWNNPCVPDRDEPRHPYPISVSLRVGPIDGVTKISFFTASRTEPIHRRPNISSIYVYNLNIRRMQSVRESAILHNLFTLALSSCKDGLFVEVRKGFGIDHWFINGLYFYISNPCERFSEEGRTL